MIDGRRGAAVLGSPIAHSLSPALHRAAYEELGLTGWTYRALRCEADGLAQTLRSLDEEGLAGVSLTMPLKRAAVGLLAEAEPTVGVVDAANTVLFTGEPGRWTGANTDVPGMMAVLRATPGGLAADEAVWVLGAGATAAATLVALAEAGSRRVTLVARRPSVAAEAVGLGERLDLAVELAAWDDAVLAGALESARLVIATTPAGATDGLAGALQRARGVLVDVVYAPWPTALGARWVRAGGHAVGGLELLVEQAVLQVELMTGQRPDPEVLRRAGQQALG